MKKILYHIAFKAVDEDGRKMWVFFSVDAPDERKGIGNKRLVFYPRILELVAGKLPPRKDEFCSATVMDLHEKFEKWMKDEERKGTIPDDIIEAYNHGTRSILCTYSAVISNLKTHSQSGEQSSKVKP